MEQTDLKFVCREGEGIEIHSPSKIVVHFLKGKGRRVELQVIPLLPATRIDNHKKPVDTGGMTAAVSG